MIIISDCQCICSDTPPPTKCPENKKTVTEHPTEVKPAKDTLIQLNGILEDFEAVREGMDFTKIHNTGTRPSIEILILCSMDCMYTVSIVVYLNIDCNRLRTV